MILAAGALLSGAVALVLVALQSAVSLFYMPAELVAQGGATVGERARIGGLVREGSLQTFADGSLGFIVEDSVGQIVVRYDGFVPDLFREGQGVVAEGVFTEAYALEASEVLAKHDETYMPREVREALEEQGILNDGKAAPVS